MSEWLKEHAWKACVGETLPWVRIPLSPPDSKFESPQRFRKNNKEQESLCQEQLRSLNCSAIPELVRPTSSRVPFLSSVSAPARTRMLAQARPRCRIVRSS